MMKDSFNSKRLVSLLFISAISLVFVLQFGPGSRGCDAPLTQTTSDVAALVNGEEIPMLEFERTYADRMQYFRGQRSPQLSLAVANQVLQQMINTSLLAQAAKAHGIEASDAELRKLIRENPNFQVNGKFDMTRYSDILRDYYKKTPAQFESMLRKELTAQKMMDVVAEGAVVSDDEVKVRFLQQGNTAQATFVKFAPAMFVDQVPQPNADAVKAYEKAHEKEIAAYYQDNRFLYHQPERVKARHILIKVDNDAPQAQKDAAKKKLEDLRAQIEAKKLTFADAAKQNSDDPGSKNQGGELGYNEKGSWVPEFANVAFSLKPGELSAPVETQLGFHLIQVEDKKPAEDKSLDQVRDEIAARLIKQDEAKQIAKKKADQALAQAKAGKSLKDLFPSGKDEDAAMMRFTEAQKPEATETGSFARDGDAVPHLGNAPELSKAVFAAQAPGLLGEVYPAGDAFVVAQVTERKVATEQEFASKKDALRDEAIRAKQMELRQSFVKSLHESAKIVTNEKGVGSVAHAG